MTISELEEVKEEFKSRPGTVNTTRPVPRKSLGSQSNNNHIDLN